jgi:cytochrome P450
MDILVAGADTTASTLTAALLHILPAQHIREQLANSLKKVDFNEQGQLALSELEKVEYLVSPFSCDTIDFS